MQVISENARLEYLLDQGLRTELLGQELRIERARLVIDLLADNRPGQVQLYTQFSPDEAAKLAEIVPEIKAAIAQQAYAYDFQMAADMLTAYRDFVQTQTELENWLGGPALSLASYEYMGFREQIKLD